MSNDTEVYVAEYRELHSTMINIIKSEQTRIWFDGCVRLFLEFVRAWGMKMVQLVKPGRASAWSAADRLEESSHMLR